LTSAVNLSIELPGPTQTPRVSPDALQSDGLENQPIGLLKLALTPRDTRVFLDGGLIGTGGQTFKITAGGHRLVLKANGHNDISQEIEIGENATKNYSFILEKKPSATAVQIRSPLDIATDLESAGKFNEALVKYQDICRKEPTNVEAFFGQARCYRAKGDSENALGSYLKAARIAGDKGDTQNQLQALSGVLEINPNYLTALYNRGSIYYNMGNYAQATQDFSKVIEIDSRHLNAHYKLAESYFKSQDFASALQTYEQTYNLNFTDPKPLAYMAETYLAMGDIKNTKKYHDKFEKAADAPTRSRFNSDPEWQRVKSAIGK